MTLLRLKKVTDTVLTYNLTLEYTALVHTNRHIPGFLYCLITIAIFSFFNQKPQIAPYQDPDKLLYPFLNPIQSIFY